jgi:hypothetical protein
MNGKLIAAMTLFLLLVAVDAAWANTGFGPATFAPFLLIPPLAALLLALGRVGLIRDRVKMYRRILIRSIVAYILIVALVFTLSISVERLGILFDYAFFLAFAFFPLFGILIGGFMICLGVRALLPNRPSYLAPARPKNLLLSGVALILCVPLIFFFTYRIIRAGEPKKYSEARTILTGIYEAEMGYFAENNTFSSDPGAVGFEPYREPRYYRWEIISADDKHFLARAWGNIDKDAELDIWEETDRSREPYRVFDDINDEGIRIDPLDPRPYSPPVQ